MKKRKSIESKRISCQSMTGLKDLVFRIQVGKYLQGIIQLHMNGRHRQDFKRRYRHDMRGHKHDCKRRHGLDMR